MRTALLALFVVALLAPVGASANVPDISCTASSEDVIALTVDGDQQSFAPSAIPSFGHDILVEVDPSSTYSKDSVVAFTYQMDLSSEVTETFTPSSATVDFLMDWDDDVSDFDVYFLDADGTRFADAASNTAFNEFVDGKSGEEAQFSMGHCVEFTIEVVNYSGSPLAQLDMDLAVRKVK